MKKIVFNSAVCLLIFFLPACKKEKKDTQSPSVSFSSPAEGQSFNVFDTLNVVVHVSDETHLTSIVVALTDLNNIPVQGNYPVAIQSNDFTFSIKYIINEYHLASGFYYLGITANDGTNSHQSRHKIYITESPTVKTGYYIAGQSQPKIITRYDVGFIPKNTISLNTGFNGMAYGAYNHQLYINGNTNQPVQAVDPTNNDQLKWSIQYNVNSWFTSISTDGINPYVGFYGGGLLSFTSTGVTGTSYVNNNSIYYPVYFTTTSLYGIGVYKDKTGGGNKLICFNKSTGIAQNSNYTPCNVIAIFEHTQDEFYILGNDANNNAVLYLYSVSNNSSASPMTLPAGQLLSATMVDPDFLLFSSASGTIYGIHYSTGNVISMAAITAQKLFYQPKLTELTASYKNNLYTYSLSGNNTLVQTNLQVMADTIIGFEVVTNK